MAMAASPTPPVPFADHCSILHNNVLYVYSPAAFQTLELKKGAQWQQETNGISVTGAICVKGGIDGDNSQAALYVVGGTTNSTTANFSGIQRYSIQDKSWTVISPVTAVTSQRQHHGAAYLNASSSIVMYGGSQSGDTTPSTETFLMLMYPPYRVQAYSSIAPPVVNPTVLTWDTDRAVLAGGSTTNQNVFLFHPDNGWQDLGLALPNPLPDRSVAQSSLVTLDDNSKILMTFRTDQSPNAVTRNVLLNPFNQPAVYGETAGDPTSSSPAATSTSARKLKRATYLTNYPTYNNTDALTTARTNFALAQGSNEQAAIVGGDNSNSVVFFNKLGNSWVDASEIVGVQKPLTSSSISSQTASATNSQTPTRVASPSATSAAANHGASSNGLAILGGVLGAICGLAGILIVLLLWLRNVRRRRQKEAAKKNAPPAYTGDKASFEEQGLQPLSKLGEPMGRSPVPSTVIDERDSMALFGDRPNEKGLETGAVKTHHNQASIVGFGQNPFRRQPQSPLTISKPMMADLGDYQGRPSIELGKATPVVPTIATSSPLTNSVTITSDTPQKADQRKTDEGWAKYFSAGGEAQEANVSETGTTEASTYSQTPVPASRRGNGGGFWPGKGISESSPRSPKTIRDSGGRTLTPGKVVAASPNLQTGPINPRTLTMSTAEGIPARISSGDSISTDVTDDDEYEDENMVAYSSGVPSVHDTAWTPVASNWSGPAQRPLRPISVNEAASSFPPPTAMSNNTSISGATTKSSILSFPMPATTVRKVQPSSELQPPQAINEHNYRTSEDYFGPVAGSTTQHPHKPVQDSTDMSWLNLGTPKPAPPPQEPEQPQ